MGKYFVSRNDSVSGPFTAEQVKARLTSSEILATDLVWGDGMSGWQNAKSWTVSPALGAIARPEPVVRPAIVTPTPAPTPAPAPAPVSGVAAEKPVPKAEAPTVFVAAKPAPKPEAETVFVAKPQPEAETVFVAALKPASEAETIFMAAAAAKAKPADAETVFIGKPAAAARDDEATVMVAAKRDETVVDIGESTKIVEGPANEQWHFAIGGKSHGPFKRLQLVEELKGVEAVGEVMLWTKGMKEWAHLFEFHEILSAIGVNKRQFPRADLPGQVLIKVGARTLTAPTLTISEGGMGVKMDSGLEPGQPVTLEIQSSAFQGPIVAKADVRYLFDGVLGLKFSQIPPEAKAAIAQLVRKTTAQFILKAA